MADDVAAAMLSMVEDLRPRATGSAAAASLEQISGRLSGPLRLAIAGKVKAGKSTLLNALLGEELAPTDAGECTRILTWYRHANRPFAMVYPVDGPPSEHRYDRSNGTLEIDLGGLEPDQIDHIEVGWPVRTLRTLTILDSPGIASISADVSARTERSLISRSGPSVADAVVYLLRHTHASDIRFLESFHDDELASGTPINTIGVLSRADEIGLCRLNAIEVATAIAAKYEVEPRMHRLCPLVIPVSGLIGRAASTLREAEYGQLARLARLPVGSATDLLLTVDRFASMPSDAVTPEERNRLLERLGLFGVRISVELIRSGRAPSSTDLCDELARVGGVHQLRDVILQQFEARSRILQARSAAAALERMIELRQFDDSNYVWSRLEEILAGAHEFTEVRVLAGLRADKMGLNEQQANELDRLLGGSGHDVAARLGLAGDVCPHDVRATALVLLERWQRLSVHPLATRGAQIAARTATRTLEGMLASS